MQILTEIKNSDGYFLGIVTFHKKVQEAVTDILNEKYEVLEMSLHKSVHHNDFLDVRSEFHTVDDALAWIDEASDLICEIEL